MEPALVCPPKGLGFTLQMMGCPGLMNNEDKPLYKETYPMHFLFPIPRARAFVETYGLGYCDGLLIRPPHDLASQHGISKTADVTSWLNL